MIRLLAKLQRQLSTAAVVFFLSGVAQAAEFEVVRDQSVFAMVTHKAGIAARLAHEHFVHPGEYTAKITTSDDASTNEDAIRSGHFEIHFLAEDLVADDPVAKERWIDGIRRLNILNKPFPKIPEKDRRKIRAAMLSDKQLDAAVYPEIHARTVGIEPYAGSSPSGHEAYTVQLEMTLHGHTVTSPFLATISLQGDILKIEANGRFKFTDFGIKPYSALMGAIRNTDNFDIYVNFTAKRRSS